MHRRFLFFLVLFTFIGSTVGAGQFKTNRFVSSPRQRPSAPKVKVILDVDPGNYARVRNLIRKSGGTVHFEYKNVHAIAAEVPLPVLKTLTSQRIVKNIYKDNDIYLPKIPALSHPQLTIQTEKATADAAFQQGLTVTDLTQGKISLDNYSPYTNNLIGAQTFMENTGHSGEGIIVGIMDSGVSTDAVAVGSRVIGGENFTDDGVPATSSANAPHGTWVAACVGANAIFGFSNPAIQDAVKRYCPECVIPNYFGDGIDGIPMVGAAPGALFYALKIFRTDGSSSNSIILAAMDRAIELKKLYNNGDPNGVNIQVINMSFGGATLYAGEDPYFAQLVEQMDDVGIIVVASVGNAGPAGLTGGDPGLAENILTVGASDDATHERIVYDIFYLGPEGGLRYRPIDNHIMAEFSSRGPTPDGRHDPEVVAPGKWRYVQHANGTTINWVSGTSFSAPTVAGVAALLLSAKPDATPDEIRGAICNGANPAGLDGTFTNYGDMGFGLVDAWGAYQALMSGASNPPDNGTDYPLVAANIYFSTGETIIQQDDFTTSVQQLGPGERKEFFLNIDPDVSEVRVRVHSVTPNNPPEQQNPLFGDDILLAIHSAKTSKFGNGNYLADTPAFVNGPATFRVTNYDIDRGVMRITVLGDWTNAGTVDVELEIQKIHSPNRLGEQKALGRIFPGDDQVYTVDVPQGATVFETSLTWVQDWSTWPTNDLDVIVVDPQGRTYYQGATLDGPEFVRITNPVAGTYQIHVVGYTIWKNIDGFRLGVQVTTPSRIFVGEGTDNGTISLTPAEFALAPNFPNPFNPATTIRYQLAEAVPVQLQIFNIRGQLVRTLVNRVQSPGFYSVQWDGRDDSGNPVASGKYIYRLQAGDFIQTRQMTLLK